MSTASAPAAPSGPGVFAAASLAGEYAERIFVHTARDVHEAIARRVFTVTDAATGGASRPVRTLHDGVSRAVYAGVGAGLRTATRACQDAEHRGVGPRVEGSPKGRFLVAAVNGLIGDTLVDHGSPLAITMAVRSRGADVPLDRDALAAAFPEATSDLVVFVHGLSESEHYWDRDAAAQGGSYGDRLARETTWTPVYLRANTGLPIRENGVVLADLMHRLVASWPTGVRRIALVGHSMGGLIVRAACAAKAAAEAPWTDLVTDVVTLGTPHLGAPIERGIAVGARLARHVPEAAPWGRIFEYRSRGVLDLRNGLAADVQHLPHARYRLVAATLASSPRHPVSEVAGDLLVRYPSAIGRPRRGPEMFPGADVLHVPRADHFDLLNHPDVYDALRRWLA